MSQWNIAPVKQHTDNSELSAGWIMVQSGVHDAGVYARIILCHIIDGKAVRVHN